MRKMIKLGQGSGRNMKKTKFTEEQISFMPKQAELGTPIDEVCRKVGISERTFYRWRSKYGGMLPKEKW